MSVFATHGLAFWVKICEEIHGLRLVPVPWRSRGICPLLLGELARKFSRATLIDPS